MAIDPALGNAQAQKDDPQAQDPAKAGDDFIPLDAADENDFAASDSDSDSDTSSPSLPEDSSPTFHPHTITLPQFRSLLSCYPTTVTQVHRRKIMLKLQPKPEKGSKRTAEKKAGSVSAKLRGAALIQRTDFNPSEQRHIEEEVGRFLELDKWRYEGLPGVIGERMRAKSDGGKDGKEGVFLSKEELIRVMEWKTKHGLPRPTLMGMVKSNQSKSVLKCTSTAISSLPKKNPVLAPNEAFPKPSLDALTPLRGVGIATASLILSIATANGVPAHQIPFYSDDLYLWLCLKDFPETESKPKTLISSGGAGAGAEGIPKKKVSKFKRPNGELNVKYNLHEYRQLWDACWELRERLNAAVEEENNGEGSEKEKKPISHNDVEKVAYVLRNIAVSGFYPDVDPEDILAAHAMQEAKMLEEAGKQKEAKKAAEDEGGGEKKSGKKRKREEKEEKKANKEKKQMQRGGRNKKVKV